MALEDVVQPWNGGAGKMVSLNDLRGLFHPKQFFDFMESEPVIKVFFVLGSHLPLLKTESTRKEGLALKEVTSKNQSRCTTASSPEKGTEHPGLHKHLTTSATFCLHRQSLSPHGRRESKAEHKLLRYLGRE